MSVTFYPNYIHTAGFSKTAEPSITTQGYACSGGETSGAAYDLVDNRNSNVITIDTNGEATDFAVDLDLTSDMQDIASPDFVIVDNHNFKTASVNVYLENDGSSTNLTSAYSGTLGTELTAESIDTGGDHFVDEPTDGVLIINFTAEQNATDQNLEILGLDDGGANFTADVTMGEIAMGKKCTPGVSPDINQQESIMYGNAVQQSRGGQKYGVQYHGKRRSWTLGWKILQETDMTNLKAVWDACNGSLYPFWIDLGEGSSNPLLYYVRFVGDFNYTKLTNQAYSLRLQIEEEL